MSVVPVVVFIVVVVMMTAVVTVLIIIVITIFTQILYEDVNILFKAFLLPGHY
jgi:hypothetical protein